MATGFAGQGGGFGSSTITDFAGGVGDILSGESTAAADDLKAQGLLAEGTEYGEAAKLAGENAAFTTESTAIQQVAIERNFEKSQGATEAEIAGAGFENSGSAQDIMRANAQQGAIAHQVAGAQGLITEAGYEEQQSSYTLMQQAANTAAAGEESLASKAKLDGEITGGIKIAAGIATLA